MPTNRQVAHMWAAYNMGTSDKSVARSSHGNFWFNRDAIFSYSTCIAAFMEAPNGQRFVLRNSRSYSITTSGKHQPAVTAALHGLALREVAIDGEPKRGEWTAREPREIVAALLTEAEDLQGKARRARSNRPWLEQTAIAKMEDARFVAMAYGIPFGSAEEMIAALRRQREGRAIWERLAGFFAEYHAAAEALFERPLQAVHDVAAGLSWLAGKGYRWDGYTYRHSVPTLLRINGDTVETSRGAEFPLKHGLAALAFQKLDPNGQGHDFGGNGPRLGHFRIDRVEPDGTVIAGCHRVPRFAVEWAARRAGFRPMAHLDHVAEAVAKLATPELCPVP